MPQQLPGVDLQVAVCDDSLPVEEGCSPGSEPLDVYPPGNPVVDSASIGSGPAHDGTELSVQGQNLGCVVGVSFGSASATQYSNPQGPSVCGLTSSVDVTSPPGPGGQSVPIDYGSARVEGARVVGIAATADGRGYWLVTDTGRSTRSATRTVSGRCPE